MIIKINPASIEKPTVFLPVSDRLVIGLVSTDAKESPPTISIIPIMNNAFPIIIYCLTPVNIPPKKNNIAPIVPMVVIVYF